jgi:hypothetical protein
VGTWGTGPFDNDEALDWVIELLADDTTESIRTPLLMAASSGGELEPWQSQRAVASAAVVAAAVSGVTEGLPVEAEEWLHGGAGLVDDDAVAAAMRALAVVLAAEVEREMWLRPEDAATWRSGVERVRASLSVDQR